MKCCGQQVIFLHFADEWWWNIENTPRQKRMFVRWWWDDVKEFEKIVVQYKTYIYRMYLILKCFCNVTLPTLSLFLFWCFLNFDPTENNWRTVRGFHKMGLHTGIVKKKGRLLSRGITIKKGTTIKGLLEKGLLSQKNQMVNKAQSLSLLVCLSAFLLLNVLRPLS